eukprot:15118565-Heterocapsa_arctica.AAC.1
MSRYAFGWHVVKGWTGGPPLAPQNIQLESQQSRHPEATAHAVEGPMEGFQDNDWFQLAAWKVC